MSDPKSISPDSRIIEGAREALSVAKGEQPAASITVNGHKYVPASRISQQDAELEQLKVDASNHAADAETVRRERDELATELCRLLDEVSYLTAALSKCEVYFDPRAESEYFHGSRIPNEEMKLLTSIRETLKKVST